MNYSDIKDLALSYSDREDAEVSNRIDNFLRIVEARINRFLQVRKMASRVVLVTDENQEYYGLPNDFNGLRDIEIRASLDSTTRTTLKYLNPEQLNAVNEDYDGIYYAIIGDQLLIRPAQENKILELIYYQKVPALSSTDTTNWLSDDYPDAYVFGILVEISAFVKDVEATQMWEQRFSAALGAIENTDSRNRWSGVSLEMRNG